MNGPFKIDWFDRWREPQNPPDPRFPHGMDMDCLKGAEKFCKADLPYPAKRCGYYFVECLTCGRATARFVGKWVSVELDM